jgi:hypothetical protein
MQLPNWDEPFKIMYDASDYMVGVVLWQKIEKNLHVIAYVSPMLDEAQCNYHATEKTLFAVVFALEKSRSYLLGTKVVVFTNHVVL